MTGMYNVLEKLRSGEEPTAKEKQIHEKGLVSVIKQIHDELDAAVFDAYGWPHNLTDEEMLERLVALNHERADEEKRGLIRWQRPEFQNPSGGTAAVQTELELEGDSEDEDETEEPTGKAASQSKGQSRHKSRLAKEAARTRRHSSPKSSGSQRPDHIRSHRQTLQISQSRHGGRFTRHPRPDRPGSPVARRPLCGITSNARREPQRLPVTGFCDSVVPNFAQQYQVMDRRRPVHQNEEPRKAQGISGFCLSLRFFVEPFLMGAEGLEPPTPSV